MLMDAFSILIKYCNNNSPPTSAEVKRMWIYASTPIRLHGVVLNQLSTGTALPYCNNRVKGGANAGYHQKQKTRPYSRLIIMCSQSFQILIIQPTIYK
jgi:hypothetical protein